MMQMKNFVPINFGLYKGKMGLCLAYFMQSKISGNKEDKQLAKKLLNEIGNNIAHVEDYSFENGLLGIGWAIEWIAQQKYLKINTNDVLEDLDDEIYKLIMYSKAENIGLENGTLGRILYLYKRVITKSSQMHFYKETSLYEVLILAIDELYEALHEKYLHIPLIDTDKKIRLMMGKVLIMLVKLKPLKFNYIVDDLLNDLTTYYEIFIKNIGSINDIKFYKSDVYDFYIAGNALNNKVWVRHAENLLLVNNKLLCKEFSSRQEPLMYNLTKLGKLTKDYSWQEGWLLR